MNLLLDEEMSVGLLAKIARANPGIQCKKTTERMGVDENNSVISDTFWFVAEKYTANGEPLVTIEWRNGQRGPRLIDDRRKPCS